MPHEAVRPQFVHPCIIWNNSISADHSVVL